MNYEVFHIYSKKIKNICKLWQIKSIIFIEYSKNLNLSKMKN